MQDANIKLSSLSVAAAAIAQKEPALAKYLSFLATRSWSSRAGSPCGQVVQNAFEPATDQDIEEISKHLHRQNENRQIPSWRLIEGSLTSDHFLPIRAFRTDASRLWGPVENLRIFLSSGTTSGPEGRSRSAYSPEGLLFYKAGSVWAFLCTLERRVPSFSADYLNMVSLSLIPRPTEWPDSSLAQMVGWFSEFWKTDYLDADNLISTRQRFEEAHASNRPTIVWGTAFHYVNLLDGGHFKTRLPIGSIVIETGGTKGKSRSVTRAELYQMISEGFGISQADIVSEYGMCELASQAWDFVEPDASADLPNRKFRFPWWVQVAVMSKPATADQVGFGALTVFDPLRIDVPGVAIQTEDMAHLANDSTFSLVGRVPRAPLKGCSLNAENLLTPTSEGETRSKPCEDFYTFHSEDVEQRAPKVRRWLLDLLSDRDAYKSLQREFKDPKLVQKTITDLTAGLPFDAHGFAQAARASIPGNAMAKRWLMIPPASHSIALIYPLACALTLGLSVRVRLPKINEISSDQTFLARAVLLAQEYGFAVDTLPPSWRLGAADIMDGESVLVFGDDETCKLLKTFTKGRVSAFGNAVSMSLVTKDTFEDLSTLRSLIGDQVSLGQRGCLSARAVICFGGNQKSIFERLASAKILDHRHETIDVITARSMEIVRLSQLGFSVFDKIEGVTIGIKEILPEALASEAMASVSRLDFVIPILLVPEIADKKIIIQELVKIPSLKALSIDDLLNNKLSKTERYENLTKDVRLVRLGTLGAPSLDGLHLGRPIFAT